MKLPALLFAALLPLGVALAQILHLVARPHHAKTTHHLSGCARVPQADRERKLITVPAA